MLIKQPRAGFTLLEILIAMSLFVVGAASIMSLFTTSLEKAKLTEQEIMLAMMQKDIAIRNQLAAYKPTAGTNFATSTNWMVKDPAAYDASLGGAANIALFGWEKLYPGYTFRVSDFTTVTATSLGTIDYEDMQFTDFDGYGWIDVDGDGTATSPNADGLSEQFGLPSPSAIPKIAGGTAPGVKYDHTKMNRYHKRVAVLIAWELNDRSKAGTGELIGPTSMTGKYLKDLVNSSLNDNTADFYRYDTFMFEIFNPDLGISADTAYPRHSVH